MSPMEVIKKLFNDHFYLDSSGELDWSYRTSTLNQVDPELANAIKRLLELDKDEKPV